MTSNPIGAWIQDNCVFYLDAFVSRTGAFEIHKNYADQELGNTPRTERMFYRRLQDIQKSRIITVTWNAESLKAFVKEILMIKPNKNDKTS